MLGRTIVVKRVALCLLTVLIVFTTPSASAQKTSSDPVQSLTIGGATLTLGENKDIVLRRLQTLFDANKASAIGADEWIIDRKGPHPPYGAVGTVAFSANKLVFASKILIDTDSAEKVVANLHTAFASLTDCRLKSSSHTVDKNSSQYMTAVEFTCGRSAGVSVVSTQFSGQKPTVTVIQSVGRRLP